ncbi:MULTISPECIES: hypothetical protein [Pandoraea]|uniref:hypothetical protein n=1 Tax=Pandoraea TaxID=93217 RepID=UPI001F5C77FE|nr:MULTISPECIES: hypothetical protein [Pandoraea]MCI3205607.1 hypothetical protein [Pandoraea sp. LA3]MDN4583635.1 hypothetical protein [Pandoraea capi]
MPQDRHYMMLMTGQHTSRDARIDRRIARVRGLPQRQTGEPAQGEARKRLRLRVKRGERSRASAASESVTRAVHRARPTHRRRSVRGAALLEVMFTLTTLMAGAQGFAHWQTAGGMSPQALVISPKVVAMAMPLSGVEGGAFVGRGYWRAGDAMPPAERFPTPETMAKPLIAGDEGAFAAHQHLPGAGGVSPVSFDAMPDGDRFAVSQMASDGSPDFGRHP